MDLEMTGLDPARHAIVEIATLVTDDDLQVVAEGPDGVVEAWNPYRAMFDVVWSGRRHVIMGGSQLDAFGNHNFAAIGDMKHPKAQLLGFRGAPGNTVNDVTS